MADSQLIYVYNSIQGTLTANPIVPNPKTATVDPGVTFAIFQADPIPENPKKRIHSQKETVFKWENHTADLKLSSGEWRKSMYLTIHQSLITCGNTTSKETDFVKRCIRVHFSTASFFHHTILAEGRDSKEVVNWLPI